MSFQHVVVDAAGPQDIWGKTVGDLNDDGLPDLIAGGHGGGGLVWYENPSWTKRTIAPSGAFSTDHEVCDVDRDGDDDVVSLQSSSLHWYEAPSWVEHTISGLTLHDIEVLDLDGDGDCDVVGRNQGSFGGDGATLYFFEQLSSTSWNVSSMSIPNGEGLASADLDGDDDVDLVVNEVWIENRGADLGAWRQHVYNNTWDHQYAFVAIADIDSDQRLDIVLSPAELQGGNYRVSWFEAPTDPTQPGWTEHVVDPSVETVHHFVGAGDFDRDGDTDIATAEMEQSSDPDQIKIYLNEGNSFTEIVISNEGSHSMRVLDVDLDGDLDLYGTNWQSDRVDLFVNQTPPNPLPLDGWQRHVVDDNRPGTAIFIDSGDINGDGWIDVAAGGYWYRNPGSPGGAWSRSAFGPPLNNLAVLDDLDGDGDPDVLGTEGVGSEAAPELVFARNDGAGGFTVLDDIAQGSGDFLQGATIARLSPGDPKRVLLSWHSGPAVVEALVVPDNPATGLWTLETLSSVSQHEALSHGDIDRDGDQDLLLGTVWLRNDGGATLTPRTLFQATNAPDRNRLADIDGDGRLDAVVGYEAISTTGVLAWYRQPPNPSDPWSENEIARLTGPMSLGVADMDRDGDLDVVVGEHDLANPENAGLFVFENTDGGGQTWSRHTVYIGDEHHDGAHVVDIDRDGDLDILSIGWAHGRVLLYENQAIPGQTGDPESDPDPDLIAAWGFEGDATDVADTSGNGNVGYLAQGATRANDGHTGKALETDGIAGHVDLGGLDVDSDELTLMAWINADDFDTADARILSKSSGTASADHIWMLSTINGPHARFRLRTDGGSGTTTLVGTGNTLAAGTWHHVAATYDGATMRLYQDGNEVGSVAKSGAVAQDPSIDSYIAANPGSSNQVFDGRIDDVKIFGRALTPTEISEEMSKPASSSGSPTIREGCYLDPELDKVLCPRSCSMGPFGRHESHMLLWLILALAGAARRSRNRRADGTP